MLVQFSEFFESYYSFEDKDILSVSKTKCVMLTKKAIKKDDLRNEDSVLQIKLQLDCNSLHWLGIYLPVYNVSWK